MFTRVTERYEAPNNGKLCKKGKFGHEFLNDPMPTAIDLGEAKARLGQVLAKAQAPVMRISPYLSGEAIDAFIQAASRRGIPFQAAGLENLDPRWARIASGTQGSHQNNSRKLILLLGDIGASNNVIFSEAYRRRRTGAADLWIAGHDDETSRRVASRVITDVQSALDEALAIGASIEAWVNPEAAPSGALDALLGVGEGFRLLLLWNSRNAGYLFTRQMPTKTPADLFLDVGFEEASSGTRRVAWGRKQGDEEVFIPLAAEHWILGTSYPTGMPRTISGTIDLKALKEAAALLS
jgi:hypothetical protein